MSKINRYVKAVKEAIEGKVWLRDPYVIHNVEVRLIQIRSQLSREEKWEADNILIEYYKKLEGE